MKQNSATNSTIIRREKEITFDKRIRVRYMENIKKLDDTIEQKEDYLKSYKKTLEEKSNG